VKRNAPERLAGTWIASTFRGAIAMGTVTDPTAVERKFGVTAGSWSPGQEAWTRSLHHHQVDAHRPGSGSPPADRQAEPAEPQHLSHHPGPPDRPDLEPRAPRGDEAEDDPAPRGGGAAGGSVRHAGDAGLTDSARALESLVRRSAEAGARRFSAQVVFLRDSAWKGFLPAGKGFPGPGEAVPPGMRASGLSAARPGSDPGEVAALKAKHASAPRPLRFLHECRFSGLLRVTEGGWACSPSPDPPRPTSPAFIPVGRGEGPQVGQDLDPLVGGGVSVAGLVSMRIRVGRGHPWPPGGRGKLEGWPGRPVVMVGGGDQWRIAGPGLQVCERRVASRIGTSSDRWTTRTR